MMQTRREPRLWRSHTLMILLFSGLLGSGANTWIRDLFRSTGTDGWMALVATDAIAMGMGALIATATALYPDAPPGRLFVTAFGRIPGGGLTLLFSLYNLGEAGRALRTAVELMHFAVLPRTPTWVLLLLGLSITTVLIWSGIEAVLAYDFGLVWPKLLLILFSLGLGLRSADWGNFLPVLGEGIQPVLQGLLAITTRGYALQLGFFYIPYFLQNGVDATGARRAVIGATLMILGYYLYLNTALLVGFGPIEPGLMTWPILEVARRSYLTGIFFERVDILLLIILLMATSCAVTLFSFAGLESMRKLVGARPHSWQVLAVVGLIFLLAYLPPNLETLERWSRTYLVPVGLGLFGLLPFLLLGAGMLRRRREHHA